MVALAQQRGRPLAALKLGAPPTGLRLPFPLRPARWLLGSGSSSSTPSQGRRRDTRSGCRSLPLPSPSSTNQTYGNGSPSFLHRCVHYSLKIPPKKRRRFSNAYLPLSHVSRARGGTLGGGRRRGGGAARAASDSAGGRNMAGCSSSRAARLPAHDRLLGSPSAVLATA